MAREKTVKGRLAALQRLLAKLTSNREELPHLEASRLRLEELINRLIQAVDLQAFHTAAKQEASRELQTYLGEGERLTTVLQLAVKQHYGIRSEKLADFGLQPFRGRTRKAKPGAEPPPAQPPVQEPTPAPAGGTGNL